MIKTKLQNYKLDGDTIYCEDELIVSSGDLINIGTVDYVIKSISKNYITLYLNIHNYTDGVEVYQKSIPNYIKSLITPSLNAELVLVYVEDINLVDNVKSGLTVPGYWLVRKYSVGDNYRYKNELLYGIPINRPIVSENNKVEDEQVIVDTSTAEVEKEVVEEKTVKEVTIKGGRVKTSAK